MGEKLLPFRAMAIPILLTDASTNVSRYGLDTSYERYISTVRRNVYYFLHVREKKTRPDHLGGKIRFELVGNSDKLNPSAAVISILEITAADG